MKSFIVDAFTDTPYSGNPAGVCILETVIPDSLMLKIAREINYSETAFLLKKSDVYLLRWFTPKTEVKLCGHATLASAHILFEKGFYKMNELINFDTKSGILTARKCNNLIELNFPQYSVEECEGNEIINKALDINPTFVGKNDNLYLIEIDNVEELIALKPDFRLLKQSDVGEILVTAKSNDKYDFYSRFFAPSIGIDEDPVTGFAHCFLANYWSKILKKNKMLAFQASERSGFMECELFNDRVLLRGNAITMNEMKNDWQF